MLTEDAVCVKQTTGRNTPTEVLTLGYVASGKEVSRGIDIVDSTRAEKEIQILKCETTSKAYLISSN